MSFSFLSFQLEDVTSSSRLENNNEIYKPFVWCMNLVVPVLDGGGCVGILDFVRVCLGVFKLVVTSLPSNVTILRVTDVNFSGAALLF